MQSEHVSEPGFSAKLGAGVSFKDPAGRAKLIIWTDECMNAITCKAIKYVCVCDCMQSLLTLVSSLPSPRSFPTC